MKKKVLKALSLVLVLSLLLSVFALTACTDKKDTDDTRTISEYELAFVGTWENAKGYRLTLNSDGTYDDNLGRHGKWKASADYVDIDGDTIYLRSTKDHNMMMRKIPGAGVFRNDEETNMYRITDNQ